ncbi:MAG: 4-alpha-glucanotransferase [Candidatus Gastranaerophilales bacterium]|nr:4-alpha-glucanotransferase [Candidatus Gastranaerophilales bacterium]
MKVSSINSNVTKPSFGRALTTEENREYQVLMKQARKSLGTGDTYMITPDTALPQEKGKNTGIGTSFSKSGQDFIKFMKKMTGITFVQYLPQGTISKGNKSPFSGSVFAVGPHLIDLEKLTQPEFNSILPQKEFKAAAKEKNTNNVNFDSVLGVDGVQEKALRKAYSNFQKLDDSSDLKIKYNDFMNSDDTEWLQRDSLYEALSEKHGNDYWKNWDDDLDKNLFSGKYPKAKVNDRISELEEEYSDTIGYNNFVQFVANEQQQETKQALNSENIKVAGDCLVGFSPRENWAFQSAFMSDKYIGCSGEGGSVNAWGLPAIDFDSIGNGGRTSESEKLLTHKLDTFFTKYDGARVDAAWELVQPYIYEQKEGQAPRKDRDRYEGDKIFNLIEKTAQKHGTNKENITYEMLGGPVNHKDNLLKGRTQIHHSIYQNPGWGSVQFYTNEGLRPNEFTFGLGTHDDIGLQDIANVKRGEQAPVLAKNLHIFNEGELKSSPAKFMRAKWAELFTARNNFFTAFDAVGVDGRFNDQNGGNPVNWTLRIPDNYEEAYHKNLTQGKGLNAARAMADAMEITGKGEWQVKEKLHKVASILEQNGPMTEAEANKKLGANKSVI